MTYDLLAFDLDGTLIDSALDLALSVNAVREYMGLGPLDHATISSYVGNGAPVLIRRALGPSVSGHDVQRGLDFFLSYYHQHRLDNTGFYPGVRESLEAFAAAGRRLAVLTNKPVRTSESILGELGASHLFFRVYGGNSFATKKPNPEGLRTLMREAGVKPERTLMIGDSSVDILTASNGGAASCGVTYGFQPESLRQHAPNLLVDSMPELAARLGVPLPEEVETAAGLRKS